MKFKFVDPHNEHICISTLYNFLSQRNTGIFRIDNRSMKKTMWKALFRFINNNEQNFLLKLFLPHTIPNGPLPYDHQSLILFLRNSLP